MTETTSTEPGNTRKRVLGGKKKPSTAAILGASPKTPAVNSVEGKLPENAAPSPSDEAAESATPQLSPLAREAAAPAVSSGDTPAATAGGGVRSQTQSPPPASPAAVTRTQPKASEEPRRAAPVAPAAVTPAPVKPAPKPPESRSTEDTETLVVDDAVSHRVSAYITGAAVKAARQTGMVRGALAIEAVEEALEAGVLRDLVELRETGVRRQGSRFPARKESRRRTSRAYGATTRTLWQPAFSEQEIAALDSIMEEVGAKNRSQLISVAVEWHMGPKAPPEDSAVDLDS